MISEQLTSNCLYKACHLFMLFYKYLNSSKRSLPFLSLSIMATMLRHVPVPKPSIFRSGCLVMTLLRMLLNYAHGPPCRLQPAGQRASGTAGPPYPHSPQCWSNGCCGDSSTITTATSSSIDQASDHVSQAPASSAPATAALQEHIN